MMMNDFGFILDTAPVRGATHTLFSGRFSFFSRLILGKKWKLRTRSWTSFDEDTQKKHKNTPRTPPRGDKKKGKRRGTCPWT